jgi:proprotein convertase subtilisin/kexin type 5
MYWDGTTCKACHASCETCEKEADRCQTCNAHAHLIRETDHFTGKLLDYGECRCDKGFYEDTNVCEPCTPLCKECVDGTVAGCIEYEPWAKLNGAGNAIECKAGTKKKEYGLVVDAQSLKRASCVPHRTHQLCPWHEFFNVETFKCEPCKYPCASCKGKADTCELCFDDYEIATISGLKTCVCEEGFHKMTKDQAVDWKKQTEPPEDTEQTTEAKEKPVGTDT